MRSKQRMSLRTIASAAIVLGMSIVLWSALQSWGGSQQVGDYAIQSWVVSRKATLPTANWAVQQETDWLAILASVVEEGEILSWVSSNNMIIDHGMPSRTVGNLFLGEPSAAMTPFASHHFSESSYGAVSEDGLTDLLYDPIDRIAIVKVIKR